MSQSKIDRFKAKEKNRKNKNIAEKSLAQKSESSKNEEGTKPVRKTFKELLEYTKVFRDPVHGDIWVTDLEQKIIDHPFFQRLRRIKQLGPTHLVYPGAVHTRFEHSLGTLHLSQKIIDSIQLNYKKHKFSMLGVFPEENFVIRIIALMHDMAHISWGHTIEDEGNLIENQQWLNTQRKEQIFGQIFPIIRRYLESKGLKNETPKILEIINKTLVAEEVGEDDKALGKGIKSLDSPFIADIVGNTICADFLDYLARDCYFSGLKMVYDPRILSYFARCTDENGKSRICILLERRSNKIRWDILNYCIDLLRMRYDIAQKLYHHRVKRNFSAVVIKMVYCARKCGIISEEDLFNYGDDVIPHLILNQIDDNNPNTTDDEEQLKAASEKLAKAFINRKIYETVYDPQIIGDKQRTYFEEIYRNPEERYKTERMLEELFNIEPGSVIIYVSKKTTGKVAHVKMGRWDYNGKLMLTPLKDLNQSGGEFHIIDTELNTLKQLYQDMWNFVVLIDRATLSEIDDKIQIKTIVENICKRTLNPIIHQVSQLVVRQDCDEGEMNLKDIDEICDLAKKEITLDYYPSPSNIKDLTNPIVAIREIVSKYRERKNESNKS